MPYADTSEAFDKMLGANLRKARLYSGNKIKDVAAKMRCSKTLVSNWELAVCKPSLENLLKLAELYNCTLLDFVAWDGYAHTLNNGNLISQLAKLSEINKWYKLVIAR